MQTILLSVTASQEVAFGLGGQICRINVDQKTAVAELCPSRVRAGARQRS